MAFHAAAEHGSVEHVERGEQRRGLWVMVAHLPGFSGGPGWVRSSAWIWLFSSIDNTTAWQGGSI